MMITLVEWVKNWRQEGEYKKENANLKKEISRLEGMLRFHEELSDIHLNHLVNAQKKYRESEAKIEELISCYAAVESDAAITCGCGKWDRSKISKCLAKKIREVYMTEAIVREIVREAVCTFEKDIDA
jgi:hypothetical protein